MCTWFANATAFFVVVLLLDELKNALNRICSRPDGAAQCHVLPIGDRHVSPKGLCSSGSAEHLAPMRVSHGQRQLAEEANGHKVVELYCHEHGGILRDDLFICE